ncbi:NAD(P)-dependent glycerol-3-phosphate dehydrogenase [Nitrosomonas sp. HPC101]|uniref:NAD(P)H-dependent glycerol-3-phosphate dehydrogenase n=1 Tax=Nitrosomonas sp. HPC101 TaxID=1658667 RepID=UPI00136E4ADF|nr:NAD(P)H-dependent glycerol-3-phosphate dehydrogenase [Nitrosomonas sp. HPC101]MXS85067.1 NAD(P)-dependent glycerol-3-phosphate dehydrogenase [Nitrosomonas sp. HPC101]
MNIAVLGAGAWGTALAIYLSARHDVALWTRNTEHLVELATLRVNQRYLPGQYLPDSIHLVSALSDVLERAELVFVVVPVSGLRVTLQQMAALDRSLPFVLGCKGFEAGSAKLPCQVVEDVYPAGIAYGVLSGPSFAREVALGLPAALTLASRDDAFSKWIASEIHTSILRVYSNHDVIGVEVGGALKNVVAIAAGISDGLAFGNNARAALITRGLAEIIRLGVALGGQRETFTGLSGIGDLILTCTGDLSRNRQVGMMLASGWPLSEILPEIGHVTEGVYTVREAHGMGQQLQIDMPVTRAVYSILYEYIPVKRAIRDMLDREPGSETD